MRQDDRPDPDKLLEKIQREERGKLTVFLGAAAGVGKTFTMLKTAQDRQSEGADVIIGWVETHGRKETEQLTEQLSRIPPRCIEYRGQELQEMDLDAILARRPEIVLVDELAHTNVPGSRHRRRFQDVEEIVRAGIDVFTTLNIQHLESLNDVVARITDVVVRETIPDFILEQADNIQLVDIPPEELIKRLREGKVYVPGQAERALKMFFRPGNINALRELALRYTAKQVDKILGEYMREHGIQGPWPASGAVMACVGTSVFSAQLIRTAHRLATGLQTEWFAVHVEVPGHVDASDSVRDRMARNMRLAEQLGGKSVILSGPQMVEEIVQFAQSNNVTSIVIGKPKQSRWQEFWKGSPVDLLIRRWQNLNIYVVTSTAESERKEKIQASKLRAHTNWRLYGLSFVMVTATTIACWWLRESMDIDLVNIALLFQMPVTFSAFWWGRWPSYFAAICGVLLFDFIFIPPVMTFNVEDIRYLWSFATFLIVAFVIGGRTELLRREADVARQREMSTRALYNFSREVAAVIDSETIARELAVQMAKTLHKQVVVLLPNDKGKLSVRAYYTPGQDASADVSTNPPLLDNAEMAVANWAYEHQSEAGRSTETLPGAQRLFLPLMVHDNIVGVLGLHASEELMTPEQRRLMEAWVGLAAIALERVGLAERAREVSLMAESDRLRTAILNSISHELRTPLASILGSASTMLEAEPVYSAEDRKELLETIREGAERMERIVRNLLDIARLEGGMVHLKKDWCDVEEIVGVALQQAEKTLSGRPVEMGLPDSSLIIHCDCVLVEHVLSNLIENAVKYSPSGTPIAISARRSEGKVAISVKDKGVGIPPDELDRIFDKFYRVTKSTAGVSGTGLGLSICRGIIEAHGGSIWAEIRENGGSVLTFTLPLEEKEAEPS